MKAVPRVRIPVLPPLNTIMKKAALLITGLLFWVATSLTVFAQEKNPNLVQLPVMVECGPVDEIANILKKYEEIPTAKAIVTWILPSGQYMQGPMTIWINPDTRTVSIVIQPNEDFACLAFPGNDFGPFISSEKQT